MAAKKIVESAKNSVLSVETGRSPTKFEYDLCTEIEGKSEIPPPPPSSSQTADDLSREIELLRKAILSEKRGRSENADIKHVYTNLAGALDGTNIASATINGVTQGASYNNRIGNAIESHSTTIRFKFWYIPQNNGLTAANLIAPMLRFVIYRDAVPDAIPPAIANFMEFTSGVPTSGDVVYTAGGASSPTGIITAVRNPLSFDRFHVYSDKVHQINDKVFWSQGGINSWIAGSDYMEFKIPHHKAKCTFASSAATSAVTNSINIVVVSDVITGSSPCYIGIYLTVDHTYSDASET